ncbi:hypothetical protein X274_07670 [Marinitoga sp. 1155]|nr:hypothetical protein X274_07670 [Marinitoga sp. 1155]
MIIKINIGHVIIINIIDIVKRNIFNKFSLNRRMK